MVNVLPPRARKDLLRFNRTRFVLVGSFAMLIGAILAFLALLPAYTAMRFQHMASPIASTTSPAVGDWNERAEILRAQALVTQFSSIVSGGDLAFEALTTALQVRPKGALIQNIRYTRGDKGSLVISGSASNRTDISTYRDVLARDTRFESVSVPAGALAGAEGGRFSITLTGMF